MKLIKELSDKIRGNIHEAHKLIEEAYRLHDIDKGAADWYNEMAVAHMKFVTNGHSNVKRLIEAARAEKKDNPLLPGMIAVYNEIHADIMAEAAYVNAMISAYK